MLSIAATIPAAIAILLTLLIAAMTRCFLMKPPTGQNAVGLVVPMFMGVAAWLLLIISVWCVVARGGFGWISDQRMISGWVVTIGNVGLLLAAGWAFFEWGDRGSTLGKAAGLTAIVLSPVLVASILLFCAWHTPGELRSARWPIIAVAPLLVISLAGYVAGFRILLATAAARDKRLQDEIAEQDKRQAEFERHRQLSPIERVKEKLSALPPGTPLWSIAAMLPEEEHPECIDLIVKRIGAVSDLDAQVRDTLETHHAELRRGVLEFVRHASQPSDAWRPGIASAVRALAGNIRNAGAMTNADGSVDYFTEITRTLQVAQRFAGVDLSDEIIELEAAVRGTTDAEAVSRALEEIARLKPSLMPG